MPRRNDIQKILVIGSGPIVIGQSAEFDYSGTQACKALKQEGYEVVLVNSNPATIMTDPELADRTYIEPLTREYVEEIIRREAEMLAATPVSGVFALLPTVGGQTALNLAVDLADSGVLDRFNVELIGAKLDAIKKAEDRLLFKDAMLHLGCVCRRYVLLVYNEVELIRAMIQSDVNKPANFTNGIAMVEGAGMYIKGHTIPVKPDISVKYGEVSGALILIALSVGHHAAYEWGESTDGINFKDCTRRVTLETRNPLDGFTPGVTYYFRVKPVLPLKAKTGIQGEGNWSQIVKILAK